MPHPSIARWLWPLCLAAAVTSACATGPGAPTPTPTPAPIAPIAPAGTPAPVMPAPAGTAAPTPVSPPTSTPAGTPGAELPTPPPAHRRNIPTKLPDGTMVEDPYRWMEDLRSPATLAWLRAQGGHARAVLDRIEGRAALQQRLAELSQAQGDRIQGLLQMPGGRIYYLKRAAGQSQYQLVMRQGADGTERVLVDPGYLTQRTGVPHAVEWFRPSWDGSHLAYGLAAGGSEDSSLFLVNLANGQPVGSPVPRVNPDTVNWLPDGRSLTFNQLAERGPGADPSDTYKDSRVLWWQLDSNTEPQPRLQPVFGPTVTPALGLDRLDVAQIITVPGSRWMVARSTDTTVPEGKLFVAPVAQLGQPGLRWRRVATEVDRVIGVALQGDTLYLLSQAGAPRRRVLQLDLADGRIPDLAQARVAVAEPTTTVLEELRATPGGLVTAVRDGTRVLLRRHARGDPEGRTLPAPAAGAAWLADSPAGDSDALAYSFTGWTEPTRWLRLQGDASEALPLGQRALPAGLPDITVTEAQAPARDGTPVPLTVLHRKGLPLDGSAPVLLEGYGAYGMSETAFYSAANMAWLEAGGVLAFVNPRGSGVGGDTWHRAGFKATKPNTWRDGIAAARWLIQQGYGSPATMAITGASAGGIFAGRAMTEEPQLFAAAVLQVGMLDAIRAEVTANGATNTSEFGSVHHPEEAPALLQMSTYHAIDSGVSYPGVLLVHGLNDPRVDAWHSAKTAARLQAAQGPDRRARPVLLRLDTQAGHGGGDTLAQSLALEADVQAFVLWQTGKRGLVP